MFKKMHPDQYQRYLQLKLKVASPAGDKKTPQQQFEDDVLDFIVDAFGALKTVDRPSFRKIFDSNYR